MVEFFLFLKSCWLQDNFSLWRSAHMYNIFFVLLVALTTVLVLYYFVQVFVPMSWVISLVIMACTWERARTRVSVPLVLVSCSWGNHHCINSCKLHKRIKRQQSNVHLPDTSELCSELLGVSAVSINCLVSSQRVWECCHLMVCEQIVCLGIFWHALWPLHLHCTLFCVILQYSCYVELFFRRV